MVKNEQLQFAVERLEIAIDRSKNHTDERFNAIDAKINGLRLTNWTVLAAVIVQLIVHFAPINVPSGDNSHGAPNKQDSGTGR